VQALGSGGARRGGGSVHDHLGTFGSFDSDSIRDMQGILVSINSSGLHELSRCVAGSFVIDEVESLWTFKLVRWGRYRP